MPHGIHTKRTVVVAEHTASRYQNDKLMQYQIAACSFGWWLMAGVDLL
jgi:hypothetical protein